MLCAALSNIRGNWPALQAVLAAIDEAGIQTIVHTGDLVVGHPWPNEVIACIRDRGIPGVQGEQDRLAIRFTRKAKSMQKKLGEEAYDALERAHRDTRSEHLEWLRGLPRHHMLTVDSIDLCVCHGTVTSMSDALREDDDEARFQRQREEANTPIVICGNSAAPFTRTVGDTLFVNPGSVGLRNDEQQEAHYAVINTETDPWSVAFEHVGYESND
jgi:predicted phosphodiesterase